MSNTISSSSNRVVVPEAKEAMDKFKMEIADELGVPLTNGYNGNLTSYQNGSVGGYMVNIMLPVRSTVFYRHPRHLYGHETEIRYDYRLVI